MPKCIGVAVNVWFGIHIVVHRSWLIKWCYRTWCMVCMTFEVPCSRWCEPGKTSTLFYFFVISSWFHAFGMWYLLLVFFLNIIWLVNTCLHLVPRLRMSVTLSTLPHMSIWHVEVQLYLNHYLLLFPSSWYLPLFQKRRDTSLWSEHYKKSDFSHMALASPVSVY